ncbi:MAG: thioesterase family protein [Chloroflexia bacterium]
MPRIYTWQHTVRSYEGDAWGQLQPSGLLRLFERAAIFSSASNGFDREFYEEQGTAWVVRRMTILLLSVAHSTDDLEISTWGSHFVRVRGGREYRALNITTDQQVAQGIAEWVYIDRATGTPKAIPADIGAKFEAPGAPLGTYEPPAVAPLDEPRKFTDSRRAEWYEIDSMGHVNNAIYADWLDAAWRATMSDMGWSVSRLKQQGFQMRAEYLMLNYRRETLPGDQLQITTRLVGVEGRLCAITQSITRVGESAEIVSSESVYGWADDMGSPCEPPLDL